MKIPLNLTLNDKQLQDQFNKDLSSYQKPIRLGVIMINVAVLIAISISSFIKCWKLNFEDYNAITIMLIIVIFGIHAHF